MRRKDTRIYVLEALQPRSEVVEENQVSLRCQPIFNRGSAASFTQLRHSAHLYATRKSLNKLKCQRTIH